MRLQQVVGLRNQRMGAEADEHGSSLAKRLPRGRASEGKQTPAASKQGVASFG